MRVLNFKAFKNFPRFTKLGLYLPIVNLTWLYPWRRDGGEVLFDNASQTYISSRTFRLAGYPSLQKVTGFSFEEWVEKTVNLLPTGAVVLISPDPSRKPPGYWNHIPKHVSAKFQSDIVILKSTSIEASQELWESIDPDFSQALFITETDVINNKQNDNIRKS